MSTLPPVGNAPVREDAASIGRWVNKEATPLLRALRAEYATLAADIAALEATVVGPAGGDLDGTYPDPSVVALTTTNGPTSLTIGAVADGEFLKRSGGTVVGGTPPTAIDPVTLRRFRAVDPGGAWSATHRFHWAGVNNYGGGTWWSAVGTNNLQTIGSGQMAYAIPEYFERSVSINRLVTRTYGASATAGTPYLRLGIYADGTYSGHPYPGARLAQSGNLLMYTGSVNKHLETSGIGLSIAAGTPVWFVWLCNNQAVSNNHTVPIYTQGVLWPILGFTMDATVPTSATVDNHSGGVGWRHSVSYTGTESLPDPFPQTGPVALTHSPSLGYIPCIGYTVQ